MYRKLYSYFLVIRTRRLTKLRPYSPPTKDQPGRQFVNLIFVVLPRTKKICTTDGMCPSLLVFTQLLKSLAYIFAADSVGLSLFKFLWWAP